MVNYLYYILNLTHTMKKSSRGRPVRSVIRENIIEILFFLKRGYGYEISKAYNSLFPAVSQRVVYYHLKQGLALDEFRIQKIVKEEGQFSWGSTVEKTYYALGPKARPVGNENVRKHFENK